MKHHGKEGGIPHIMIPRHSMQGNSLKKVKSKSVVLETPMPILSWFLETLRLTRHSLTVYIYEIFNDILSFPTHRCSTVTLGYRTRLY